MKDNKFSFWNLLKEYKVVIPIIQRDYAQGREGQEYLRVNILEQLSKAIIDRQTLELDFVYGTLKDGVIYPLDGQQRLTTLWLLHWYIAFKGQRLNDEDVKNTFKNFSYETRSSSREFCEKLCHLKYKNTDNIVEYITKQTWFFLAWKQDPTIKSMLRMLSGIVNNNADEIKYIDGIEKLYKDTPDLIKCWDFLTSDNCKITFSFLPLNTSDLPISDDLYIKMNARGKALTSFENLKADLIKWKIDADSDGAAVSFASKIDNKWTDVFWTNGKEPGRVDEIFFAFINRYFYNLAITKENINDDNASQNIYYSYFNDSTNRSDFDKKIAYSSFELYKHFLNEETIENLSKILDNVYESVKNGLNIQECFKCFWNDEFRFIPEYRKEGDNWKKIYDNSGNLIYEVTALNQMERVVFYAICKYFKAGKVEDDGKSLRNWMRFVWNLVSDFDVNDSPTIRNISAMQAAINLIDKINDPHNIYTNLRQLNYLDIDSDMNMRFNEEIAKANQIMDGNAEYLPKEPLNWDVAKNGMWNWENAIIKAENFAFFKGAIRFLFTDEYGEMKDWSNFSIKWENAQIIFDENGLTEVMKRDARAIRIFLSYCDKWWDQIQSDRKSYKYIFSHSKGVWRNNILLKHILYAKPIHNLLMYNGLCESPNLVDDDVYRNLAFDRIIHTDVIAKINSGSYGNTDKYYIRWKYGGLSLYPSSTGIILTKKKRDEFLFELYDKGIINIGHDIIIDTHPKMFFGWNIRFEYKDYTFQWQHWNYIDMYADNKRLPDVDKYKSCCINENELDTTGNFIERLNECIEKYETIKLTF